jgi:hypothetical protein
MVGHSFPFSRHIIDDRGFLGWSGIGESKVDPMASFFTVIGSGRICVYFAPSIAKRSWSLRDL